MKKSDEKVTVAVNASAEKVWKIIGAVDGVDKWFAPVIQSCRVEGNKRICGTEAGEFTENIEKVDYQNRIFQYSIPEQNMIPVKNIFGTMKVNNLGNGKSSVEWSATFDVEENKETEAKEMFKGSWTMGIKGIETYVLNNTGTK
ncbi:MAG: SRPBCC family protein [Ignavibacteriae bacterium]|nr:SRPBCC family protein [Ignavibacteriota bacterium]